MKIRFLVKIPLVYVHPKLFIKNQKGSNGYVIIKARVQA